MHIALAWLGYRQRCVSPFAPRRQGAAMIARAARSRFSRWLSIALVVPAILGALDRARADAAIIYVTSSADKFNSTGGCSLKEAIYSANTGSNAIPGTGLSTGCA